MPHRNLLTESQWHSFQAPTSDEREMVRNYTFSAEDLGLIDRRHGGPNRMASRSFSATYDSQAGYCSKVSDHLLHSALLLGGHTVDDNENVPVPVSSPWALGDNLNAVGDNFL